MNWLFHRRCMGLRLLAALAGAWFTLPALSARAADRPNILWITCEDISPNLGCYGDPYARTPNLDRMAAQGVRYTQAFAPIGVCAPARTSLILGMYASSVGAQYMRCQGPIPSDIETYSWYLRQAGYYCTNNSKTDYNFKPNSTPWDESSGKAHYKNRAPGQPFFAIFNLTSSHESQIRLGEKAQQERREKIPAELRHDPAQAIVPPYHPDTPEVRQDWANYADNITFMDQQAGVLLDELEQAGLAEDTIVWFYGDHGAGMPRSKRWLYDSSTQVPLLIRFPAKYQDLASGAPGSTCDRLVNFVDFGPTALSLAGAPIPAHMQGVAFLGSEQGPPRPYVHGFRDRMDERYDLIRMARDDHYTYIRNYHPERPWFHEQHINYLYQMPTMQVWQRLADEGKLEGPTALFMAQSKPTEELYDNQSDPWNIQNLAEDPAYRETLERMRGECRRWQREIMDLGLLTEADLRTRFGKEAPHAAVRRDPALYPFDRIAAAADLANARDAANEAKLISLLEDGDPAVRYWAAIGLGGLPKAGADATTALRSTQNDTAAWVRVAACDALLRQGEDPGRVADTLATALADSNEFTRLEAINVVDRVPALRQALRDQAAKAGEQSGNYVQRVAEHVLAN